MRPLDGGGGGAYSFPGDPAALDDLARQLATLANGLSAASAEITGIRDGTWVGPAASAFDSVMKQQPGHYSVASGAFGAAANAIAGYAQVLSAAQGVAAHASSLAEQALVATENWRGAVPQGRQPTGTDPGEAHRQEAAYLVSAAQHDLAQAAAATVAALHAAEHGAPHKPGLLSSLLSDAWDVVVAPVHFGEGVVEGAWGLVGGVYELGKMSFLSSPLMFLIDHGAWQKQIDEFKLMGEGIAQHPLAFAKAFGENLVDWNEWSKDPARALGQLVPAAVLAVATGGSGSLADGAGAAAGKLGEGADALEKAGATALESAPKLAIPVALAEQLDVALTEDGLSATRTVRVVEALVPDSSSPQYQLASTLSDAAATTRQGADVMKQVQASFKGIERNLEHLDNLETGTGVALNTVQSGQQAAGAAPPGRSEHVVDQVGANAAGKSTGKSHAPKISDVHATTPNGDEIHIFLPVDG